MINKIKFIKDKLTTRLRSEFNNVVMLNHEISSSNFLIRFVILNFFFTIKLSTHHLDIPWQLSTLVEKNGNTLLPVEKYLDYNYDYELNPKYEVTPKLLENKNGEIEKLIELFINDLKDYLKALNLSG
ncbi:MAG: hypothetical protein ACK4ND_07725 [Cytophagaceae bacterium]